MDGIAKYLSADMPVLQITWARYFFTVVFTLPIMFLFFNRQLTWSEKPKLQIIRGIILLCANICFFYSISIISLKKTVFSEMCQPLLARLYFCLQNTRISIEHTDFFTQISVNVDK